MASGAGLNRWSDYLLTLTPNSVVNPDPNSDTASPGGYYGADSNAKAQEARDFTKPTFTLIGDITGYEVSLYGTNDPRAYKAWCQQFRAKPYPGGVIVLPPSSWKLLDGPADTAGAGTAGNPLTDSSPILRAQGPWLAYRAVLTANAGTGGTAYVTLEIAP